MSSPDSFREFLIANASKDWLARNSLSTAEDLLRVLGGTRPGSTDGLPAAAGQTDAWDAVFAAVILRKYAQATPEWTTVIPAEAVVAALRNHRGITEGQSWQVRKHLYLLLAENPPAPHEDVKAMAYEEGVAPIVYRDALEAADLYVMKCYGVSPREHWSANAPREQLRR